MAGARLGVSLDGRFAVPSVGCVRFAPFVFRSGVVLKKAQTMKNITALLLVFVSVVISGCKPNTQPADTHPANLVGKWKAEFTTKIRSKLFNEEEREANVTIGITTETNGSANFEEIEVIQHFTPQTETISGSWKQTGDYLIIERPNGGFVAFRISSQSTNQLTVFARTGQTIQFNRIP